MKYTTSFLITKETREKLVHIANVNNLKINNVINLAIYDYFADPEYPNTKLQHSVDNFRQSFIINEEIQMCIRKLQRKYEVSTVSDIYRFALERYINQYS